MASKRDPQKQAELDAARERILKERAERASDVVPVAHDAPSYDVFDAAPSLSKSEAESTMRAMAGVVEKERANERAMRDAFRRQNLADADAARLDFIDRTAIGLYVSGYPQTKIYDHAARLWELRAQWRKGQGL